MATKGKTRKAARPLGKAKGETRAVRVRYVEPPAKRYGAPFFAVRVPADVLKAFGKWCDKRKQSTQDAVREFMSKATGVPLTAEGSDE